MKNPHFSEGGVTPSLEPRGGRAPVQGERSGRNQRAEAEWDEHRRHQQSDRRKYLLEPGQPVDAARPEKASKLEPFKVYLNERLQAGVWNTQWLLRELRERNYQDGYTILTDWLRPLRESAKTVAVQRFETPSGKQAQVDLGHLGWLAGEGEERKIWGFAITLGYSRMMVAEAATDQKLGTLLRMHEMAFRQWGAVPEEILYDRMKTVWNGADERGEIIWNSIFLDFARYWGFHPAAVPAVSGADEGKDRVGHQVHPEKFPVRVAEKGTEQPGGLQRDTAPLGGGGGQSARARHDA